MAQYNFKGDLNDVSDRQLEFINKIIKERGFLENSRVTFAPVGKAGDNYVASVKRITVEGNNDSLSMIAKLAPTNEVTRQVVKSELLFQNELTMYHEVLPKFVQIQKEAGIPEKELFRYAECYGLFAEKPNEVILLEDLQVSNFTMLDRFESLSNDCIRSVLKNFAMFHSLSYVLKQKEPETYNQYKSKLVDTWAVQSKNEDLMIYFAKLEKDTLTILDDTYYTNILKSKISNCFHSAANLTKAEDDNNYAVIVQGDAWTNNIMFRFKDDTLQESIMIDYQISRNASLAYDIMYLIFNCTDHEMRMEHYHDWVNFYYSELDKCLSNFDLKAEVMYPRHQLDADFKRYANFLLGFSICLVALFIRKSEDAAKLIDAIKSNNMVDDDLQIGVTQLDEESRNLFKNRVIGLVRSFIEFKLIKYP